MGRRMGLEPTTTRTTTEGSTKLSYRRRKERPWYASILRARQEPISSAIELHLVRLHSALAPRLCRTGRAPKGLVRRGMIGYGRRLIF